MVVGCLSQVKGVNASDDHTGESRQQILFKLHRSAKEASGAGLPVLFVKEYDNPFDANAVAVVSSVVRLVAVCNGVRAAPSWTALLRHTSHKAPACSEHTHAIRSCLEERHIALVDSERYSHNRESAGPDWLCSCGAHARI